MSLSDEQRQLITTSFARLVPTSDEAAARFYDRLWTIAPETRPLFANTDMEQQKTKLMQTLGLIVRSLHDTEAIAALLHDLGARHVGYGVTKAQYAPVGAALLWMIEQTLGDDFSDATRDAWAAGYDLIATLATHAHDA